MPKLKSHSGAKKRFNLTKTGKVKRAHAFKSHILNKKSTKRKRGLRQGAYADATTAPTAVPQMQASLMGVLNTRRRPKVSSRPLVSLNALP